MLIGLLFSFHRVRNKRELNAKLKGATLGEAEGDVDDTLKWIKRSKKKEKELAKKRQQELENMDKVFQEEYTESAYHSSHGAAHFTDFTVEDLEGLKVSHDFEAMEEGEERILTLKDSRILEDEGMFMSRTAVPKLTLYCRGCSRERRACRR